MSDTSKDRVNLISGPQGARLAIALGLTCVWLVLIGIIGAIAVSDDDGDDGFGVAAGPSLDGSTDDVGPIGTPAQIDVDGDGVLDEVLVDESGEVIDPGAPTGSSSGGQTSGGSTSGSTGGSTGGTSGGTTGGSTGGSTGGTGGSTGGGTGGQPAPGTPTTQPAQQSAGDRTGVNNTTVKLGFHAPETFDGAPINLAEDPIAGIEAYVQFINDNGGIHGRKIQLSKADDRFNTPGAEQAADKLINDEKNFAVSGTLGIDQIAVVAAEAKKRGVPYMAAGGPETGEPRISDSFQLVSSYDNYSEQLARWMNTDPKYKGKKVGILVSDTPLILPAADIFKREWERLGNKVVSQVRNQKPQDETRYQDFILQFRNDGVEVVIPLTDPISTSRLVQQCAAGALCGWTYSFANYAHDSDTALALMEPVWADTAVRGLSSGCYYQAPEIADTAKCGSMAKARDQFIAIHDQARWNRDGSGASAGYQIVSIWREALQRAGADLTRERYQAAIGGFVGYADLVTAPITYQGKSIHDGTAAMTILEATNVDPPKYKMISPGFLTNF